MRIFLIGFLLVISAGLLYYFANEVVSNPVSSGFVSEDNQFFSDKQEDSDVNKTMIQPPNKEVPVEPETTTVDNSIIFEVLSLKIRMPENIQWIAIIKMWFVVLGLHLGIRLINKYTR